MTLGLGIFNRIIASRRRGICIWLGFAVILTLALFPPWTATHGSLGEDYPAYTSKLWHAPLWRAPRGGRLASVYVDYPRMLTEIAVGECFVLALYLTWAKSSKG